MVNLGYACINLSLKPDNISTNRGMIKSTFLKFGPSYAAELALKNLQDVIVILKWNIKNDIKVYRMSSSIFPWMSEYNIEDLSNFSQLVATLKEIGKLVLENDLRIGFHPGQFNILCSSNEDVVRKTVKELNQHSQIIDLMDLPVNQHYSINIHIGAAYNDKKSSLETFISNFSLLGPATKSRLVIENDDKINMYTVEDLMHVSNTLHTPITFDYFHHSLNPGNLTEEEALKKAVSTWAPLGIRPLCHYSNSKQKYEDPGVMSVCHSDWIYERVLDYDLDLDIELEVKQKDLAVLNYRRRLK